MQAKYFRCEFIENARKKNLSSHSQSDATRPTNASRRNGAATSSTIAPMRPTSKTATTPTRTNRRPSSKNTRTPAHFHRLPNRATPPPSTRTCSAPFIHFPCLATRSPLPFHTCNVFSFNFYSTFFFNSSRPFDVVIPRAPPKTKSTNTRLEPIALNDPIDILDKAKRNRVKNGATFSDSVADDDEEEEIQGDASGLTIPLSKSLGTCVADAHYSAIHHGARCACDGLGRAEITFLFGIRL